MRSLFLAVATAAGAIGSLLGGFSLMPKIIMALACCLFCRSRAGFLVLCLGIAGGPPVLAMVAAGLLSDWRVEVVRFVMLIGFVVWGGVLFLFGRRPA